MATLVTGSIEVEEITPYLTVAQLAAMFGVPEMWIRAQVTAGVIAPALTKGLHQFSRGAVLRLSAFLALKNICGQRSPLPAQIIAKVGPTIDALCKRPDLYPAEASAAMAKAVTDAIWTEEVEAQTFQRLDAAASA